MLQNSYRNNGANIGAVFLKLISNIQDQSYKTYFV